VKRSGWLTFSGVVLVVAGLMRILDALWAFRYNGDVVDNLHDALFGHSLTTYGWIWLVVGVILMVSGYLILSPATLAGQISRWIGIVAAAVAGVTAVTWMPYYPVWSLTYIALSVMVIYGISAHFGEQATTS